MVTLLTAQPPTCLTPQARAKLSSPSAEVSSITFIRNRDRTFKMKTNHPYGWLAAAPTLMVAALGLSAASAPVRFLQPPAVEIEETVYRFTPADNGAGPMWCHGSTCLVRVGGDVFASGLETLPHAKPLNNCRWLLFHRGVQGWKQIHADVKDRTREPCPLAVFADGRIFLSANPTVTTNPAAYSGPARPEILQLSTARPEAEWGTLVPAWEGTPEFTEHSYRSFAADGEAGELVLFQNIGYTHAEWTFRDRRGHWSARGRLQWPWGADYAKPEPIRVCYPNVALRQNAVYFCGVSDIIEPNPDWRAFKKELTGREWDYDFRRLFFTWSSDITTGRFHDWLEIASRERTGGWITPGDLWVGPDGTVHILWTERALDERLREKFFPGAKQSHALNYATVRDGKVIARRTLLLAEAGGAQEVPGRGRFHVTPDQRLFVVFYVSGTDAQGRGISENRLLGLLPDGSMSASTRVPLRRPFAEFYTATPRAGSAPSFFLDLLGQLAGESTTISYARLRVN